MADQLVFVFADYASGVAADRVSRAVGRIGQSVLAATLVSCAAFLALPFVAPGASPAIFLALTLIWAVTSSALRAPPLSLRRRARGQADAAGPGGTVAAASGSPMRCRLPRPHPARRRSADSVPAVERGARAGDARAGGGRTASWRASAPPAARRLPRRRRRRPMPMRAAGPAPVVIGGAVRRARLPGARLHRQRAALPAPGLARAGCRLLSPLFWIGFNLGLVPLSLAAKRWPPARVMGVAALVAAAAAGAATLATTLANLYRRPAASPEPPGPGVIVARLSRGRSRAAASASLGPVPSPARSRRCSPWPRLLLHGQRQPPAGPRRRASAMRSIWWPARRLARREPRDRRPDRVGGARLRSRRQLPPQTGDGLRSERCRAPRSRSFASRKAIRAMRLAVWYDTACRTMPTRPRRRAPMLRGSPSGQ